MAPSSSLVTPALLLLHATSVLAQTYAVVDYTKLPACAKNCAVLTNAEKACIPPAQAVTSQNAYQGCLCSSPQLAGFYATAQAACTDVCTAATDLQRIKDYYVNLCTAGIVVTPGVSSQTATVTGSAATATTDTASASTSTDESSSSNGSSTSSHPSWFSSHWKWVLMLIIVFVAMILFSILGICLKRRHRRKRDAEGANVAARNGGRYPRDNNRPVNGRLQPPPASMKEMTMSGGVAAAAPVAARSQRTLTRPQSTHANAVHPSHPPEFAHLDGELSGYDREAGAGIPMPQQPVYAGHGDLPDRMYSPVVSRRGSDYLGSRASTAHPEAYGHSISPRGFDPPSPVSPIDDTYGGVPAGVPGSHRMREMQSAEAISARGSPLSASEPPALLPRRSSKRLSKKVRNAS